MWTKGPILSGKALLTAEFGCCGQLHVAISGLNTHAKASQTSLAPRTGWEGGRQTRSFSVRPLTNSTTLHVLGCCHVPALRPEQERWVSAREWLIGLLGIQARIQPTSWRALVCS